MAKVSLDVMERGLGSNIARSNRGREANARNRVAAWLFVCCALVFAIVVMGGVTRLTHSGLSITEWQPIVGTVPPLSATAWQEAFAKYQQTPEFQQVNRHMTMAKFKPIFWMEWVSAALDCSLCSGGCGSAIRMGPTARTQVPRSGSLAARSLC